MTSEPKAGDLGSCLLLLVKNGLPQEHWVQTWSEEELVLFDKIVTVLHSSKCIEDESFKTVRLAIEAKLGRFARRN
jgi:hypothetical protein